MGQLLSWSSVWQVSLEQEILILCPLVVGHPWGRWGEEEQGRREGDKWRWEGEGQAEEELKRLHLCSRRFNLPAGKQKLAGGGGCFGYPITID